jgi:hypothetical protein
VTGEQQLEQEIAGQQIDHASCTEATFAAIGSEASHDLALTLQWRNIPPSPQISGFLYRQATGSATV